MSQTNMTPEALAEDFRKRMNAAGYEALDSLVDSLAEEFTNCKEADAEDDCNNSLLSLLDAIQYAASRMAMDHS